jgi:hypothetical protein
METAETMPERIDSAADRAAAAPANRAAADADRAAAPANRASAARFMKAMRERDYDAIADVLAPDVVINSPITDSFDFHGREDAVALLKIVCAAMEDLEHHELLGADDVWFSASEFASAAAVSRGWTYCASTTQAASAR